MKNDFILLLIDAGEKEIISSCAEEKNEILSQFCLNAILEKIKNSKEVAEG